MRVLLQNVSSARVDVDGRTTGEIGKGYLLFLGVMQGDDDERARWLAEKIVKLRLFPGSDGKINDQTLLDVQGEILVVSQFTLAGDVAKGSRPDYTAAAERSTAERLYERFMEYLRAQGVANVASGRFGAMMRVHLVNEGPVTLLLER